MLKQLIALVATALFFAANPAAAQESRAPSEPSYAQLVKLADDAEIIASVRVKRAINLSPERAPDVAPGHVRIYVEAQVLGLIRGKDGLAESIRYLVDMPMTARGKAPRLKKQNFLLFARPGSSAGEVQLVGRAAQQPGSPMLEQRTRAITADLLAAGAPPAITTVREAFHVQGNLRGEGETQIFLNTADDTPVSISILRRPNQAPRWDVSLSEIVDASATRPERNTLLWYRLACGLPATIPANALFSIDAAANEIAQEDYAMVLRQLGPCR